ncbi:nuclease [Mesorhizobium sp. GR13]|uniref:nuclease n=1 Tax=Mesorhizobium sp. GR13 TaxID=2562308 RepID=UPI001FEEACE6|nr:nuclease [Mesorhizobium sp. GR13]
MASAASVAAQQATAPSPAKFVEYYQNAYASGRDLVPGPQQALNSASRATALKLETILPEAALTGNSFVDAQNTIIQLVGPQGCQSTQQLQLGGMRASCTILSLAGLNAALQTAATPARGAFPCHFLGTNSGQPSVRFAECFFIGPDDHAQPLSEYLIRRGLAFAAREPYGAALFPEYTAAEAEAAKEHVGIWSNATFRHPYGERYRQNQTN